MQSEVGTIPLIIAGVVALICFLIVRSMATAAKSKLIGETKTASTSVAKKIVGNENEEAYDYIYITGEHWHNEALIDDLAQKILSAIARPQNNIEKEVARLFPVTFINTGEFAKQLPQSFTNNIPVWKKQIKLKAVPGEIKQNIRDEDGKFAVVAMNPEYAMLLQEYYKP